MTTVTIGSLKGGVGKSSLAIQLGNCLGKAGKKVVQIDMDVNNSVSSYYLTDETKESISTRNIANALDKTENDLSDFTVSTEHENVELIASSLYLIDRRTISEKRLSQLLPKIKDKYDFVIIDTAPTYDNIVLNAYNASDFIITPANLSLFDLNTTEFLRDKIKLETDKIDSWFVLVNGYNTRFERSARGKQKEYMDLFKERFANLLPRECFLPWTKTMRDSIDRNMSITSDWNTAVGKKDKIFSPLLYAAITSIADKLLDDGESLNFPEAF